MRIRRSSCAVFVVTLFTLAAGGCPKMPAGAQQQSSDGKTMTLAGPLHAPGAGGSTNATEWTIEIVQESIAGKKKQFLAVDVSGVQEQAKALEGQRVSATVQMPTQEGALAGQSGLRVLSIAPAK